MTRKKRSAEPVAQDDKLAAQRATGSKMPKWRRSLFVFMSNNAYDATEYFRIPPNRVVELGGQVEI